MNIPKIEFITYIYILYYQSSINFQFSPNLDGLDVSPLKWRVCGCGLNRLVHEGMNHISNVEVHLKTRSGNVNIEYKTFYNCRANQE